MLPYCFSKLEPAEKAAAGKRLGALAREDWVAVKELRLLKLTYHNGYTL